MARVKLLLPREHGAWAMLLVPFAVGVGAGQGVSIQTFLFLCTILLLFFAHNPLTSMLKKGRAGLAMEAGYLSWVLIYGALGAMGGLLLLFVYGRWWLVPLVALATLFSGAQLYLSYRRLERTVGGELLAIAGLSLAGPAANYISSPILTPSAFLVYVLVFLYSGSSVFYVKMKVRQRLSKSLGMGMRERLNPGEGVVLYMFLIVIILGGLTVSDLVPPLVFLAFLPLLYKLGMGVISVEKEINIRRVGFIEVGHAVLFTGLAILTYRLGSLL